MNMKLKFHLSTLDPSGMILSLSGILLGILLAVADYHVDIWSALSLILTAGLIHFQMVSGSKGTARIHRMMNAGIRLGFHRNTITTMQHAMPTQLARE